MTSPATTPRLPISARYVVSDKFADEAESAMKEVFMPFWLQITLPFVVGMQALMRLPDLLEGGGAKPTLMALVLCASFYGFMFWRRAQNQKAARAAILGKQIVAQFREDAFDFSIGPNEHSLDYLRIVRAGRDEEGLVLIIEKLGGLWIPTEAFASPEERDYVFSHLGQVMKRK